jgi:hypothetical protein
LSYLWLVVARQRIVRLQDVGLAKWSAKWCACAAWESKSDEKVKSPALLDFKY